LLRARFSFLLMRRPPRTSTLFPYTTLFRSQSKRQSLCKQRMFFLDLFHDLLLFSPDYHGQKGKPFFILEDLQLGKQRFLIPGIRDRKSTRLNSSHVSISYAVFCLKKKTNNH